MNARYCPCFGVNSGGDSAARFIVALDNGGSRMNIRYRVDLNEEERAQLTAMLSGGKHAARRIKRAQILLAAGAGISDEEIARTVSVGGSTVYRTKRRFVTGNLADALSEEPRPGAARKLSGKETALLVATACSDPPEGRKRWTLDLLAGAMVQLTEHEAVSRETVRRRLEHFPIRWNHLIGSNALLINELEHYSRANRLGKCSSRGRPQAVATRYVVHPPR